MAFVLGLECFGYVESGESGGIVWKVKGNTGSVGRDERLVYFVWRRGVIKRSSGGYVWKG